MAKIVSKLPAEAGKTIHVRGAREHNLKNVDLEIPLVKVGGGAGCIAAVDTPKAK